MPLFIRLAIPKQIANNTNKNHYHLSDAMSTPLETKEEAPAPSTTHATLRMHSRDLLQQARAIEIEHAGKIYTLRLTQLNKLILTA